MKSVREQRNQQPNLYLDMHFERERIEEWTPAQEEAQTMRYLGYLAWSNVPLQWRGFVAKAFYDPGYACIITHARHGGWSPSDTSYTIQLASQKMGIVAIRGYFGGKDKTWLVWKGRLHRRLLVDVD